MSAWWYLGGVEAVIVVGSYIEAKARKRIPVLRWAWWHLVIVWAVWVGTATVLVRCVDRAMFRGAEVMVVRSQAGREARRPEGFRPDPQDWAEVETGRILRRWSPSWARLLSLS